MVANQSTFDRLAAEIPQEWSSKLIHTTEEEETEFRSYLGSWDGETMALWQQLMAGTGKVTDTYVDLLHRVWSEFPFDAIVYWGDNGAVSRFADEFAITKVAMELGCTRPPFFDSVTMDPFGANGSGTIARLTIDDLKSIVGANPMSAFEAIFGFSDALTSDAYRQQFDPLPHALSSRLPDEKIVFFPLQLFDDANLLRFSHYETVMDVVLDTVPALVEAGYTVVVKPHPAATHREGASLANLFGRHVTAPYSNKLIWLDEPQNVSNARLFSISDFVVTVNSSVGFEALYFDKPVVVLGDSSYKPKGVFPTLHQMISGEFNYEKYKEDISILRRFVLEGYLLPSTITTDTSEFVGKIATIDGLTRGNTKNYFPFAHGYWQAVSPARRARVRSSMSHGGVLSQPFTPVQADTTQKEYRAIVNRLLAHSESDDMGSFADWLQPMWASEEDRIKILEIGEFLDSEFYLETYPDIRAAEVDALHHFSRHGMDERRLPRANMHGATSEEVLAILQSTAEQLFYESQLPVYPLESHIARAREQQLGYIGDALNSSDRRIAVVAHLYYEHLVPQLLESLREIREPFDLIVTMPSWGTRRILDAVKIAHPHALFYEADNRGRDIAPLIDILPILTEKNYDAVLKVHTKLGYFRNGRLVPSLGKRWRDETLRSLTGSRKRVEAIIDAFRENASLNMIGSEPYLVPIGRYPYSDDGRLAEQILGKTDPVDKFFFAGTMFWFRPGAYWTFSRLNLENFAPETGAADGALAHIVERMFGHAAGYERGGLWSAPIEPSSDLITNPTPSNITLDSYLSS
ncbi:rhamnan synthesis F family protein [Martelella sp. FLE1502]